MRVAWIFGISAASREDSGIPRLEVLPDLLQVSFAVSVRLLVLRCLTYHKMDSCREFSVTALFCKALSSACRNGLLPQEVRIQVAGMSHFRKKRESSLREWLIAVRNDKIRSSARSKREEHSDASPILNQRDARICRSGINYMRHSCGRTEDSSHIG